MLSVALIIYNFLPDMGILLTISLFFIYLMIILMFDCPFLMIHICYFIVTHCLRVLRYQLNQHKEPMMRIRSISPNNE